jgi:hypothetical protein
MPAEKLTMRSTRRESGPSDTKAARRMLTKVAAIQANRIEVKVSTP